MMLDIDRLHNVLNTVDHRSPTSVGRGEGKTTALLYLIVGECHLGNAGNVYLYMGHSINHCRSTMTLLESILSQEGFANVSTHKHDMSITVQRSIDEPGQCVTVLFRSPNRWSGLQLAGNTFADVYLDITAEKFNEFYEEMIKVMSRVIPVSEEWRTVNPTNWQ